MTNGEDKKKSGCGKWLGCGCLVLVIIAVVGGISGWLLLKKMGAPGEAHAGHFIPEEASGWGQINLQKADEGMSDLFRFVMEQIQENQPQQEGITGMLQTLFGKNPTGKPSPIGPAITGWMMPGEDPERPNRVLVVDLNTINKFTATTLQLTLSTLMGAEAQKKDVDGVSLYVNPKSMSYISHKGFLVFSESPASLESAARRYLDHQRQDWPNADQYINSQDIRLQWSNHFETFNTFTTDVLGLANPKDGDFKSPSRGLENIDLEADVISSDEIQFTVRAQAKTLEDARRILADLTQHAGELQQKLHPQNLHYTYTATLDGTTAELNGTLTGLTSWLSNYIAQRFNPKPESVRTF